eukprot:354096_1
MSNCTCFWVIHHSLWKYVLIYTLIPICADMMRFWVIYRILLTGSLLPILLMLFIIECSVCSKLICFRSSTCFYSLYKFIPQLIYRSLVIFFAFIFLNGTSWSSNDKLIMRNIMKSHTLLYDKIIKSSNMEQVKFKIITINYIYAYEIELHAFIDFIDTQYKLNKIKDISLENIRQHSYPLWTHNSSFLSFISYCTYFLHFNIAEQPTNNEWKYSKICQCFDICFGIIGYLFPLFIIPLIEWNKLGVGHLTTLENVVIILWTTQIITWILLYKFMFIFYIHISHFLPYLCSRDVRKNLDISMQNDILAAFDDVYDSLTFDHTIGDIINECVYPTIIAHNIISFLKVNELSDAVEININCNSKMTCVYTSEEEHMP